MSEHAAPADVRRPDALRPWRGPHVGPVLVAVFVVVVVGWPRLEFHEYDISGFVHFGQNAADIVMPPREARIVSEFGYDGQFFWLMALSPALGPATQKGLQAINQEYRAQRVLYPSLATALAARQPELIPWTLLLINVIVILVAVALGSWWAATHGRSPYWGLSLGLTPGLVLGMLRDLSDPLATLVMVGGLLAWRMDRRVVAALLLSLAVLTRETMIIAVAAVGLEVAWRVLHATSQESARNLLRTSWPLVVAPAAVFLAWQTYATARLGVIPALTTGANADIPGVVGEGQFVWPFEGLVRNAEQAAQNPHIRGRVWDWAYLTLMVAATIGAVRALVRGPGALPLAGVLFAAIVLTQVFGDHWSYTRASAPLFACVLLAGLADGDRWGPGVAAAAAALVPLLPDA